MKPYTKDEVEAEAWFGGQKERVLVTLADLAQARLDHQSEADALRVERNATARDLARVTAELAASEALCEATQTERAAEIERATKLSAEVERLKRERDELRGRVVDLTGDVARLRRDVLFAQLGDSKRDELAAPRLEVERLRAEATTTAERQREACARHASPRGSGVTVTAPPRVECAACAHLPDEQRGLASCGCLANSEVKR